MRQFTRHPTDIPIFLSLSDSMAEPSTDSVVEAESVCANDCSMTDVSLGGMACEVPAELQVGALVDVNIPSVQPCYTGHGEVVWCKRCMQGFEVGIRFVDTEEAYKSRMVQQVCQIEHYKNQVFEQEGRLLDTNEAAAEWVEKYAADFPR